MKDMLFAVLALVSAALAVFSWFKYTGSADNRTFLIIFAVLVLSALVFGAMFLAGRVNKNEDIHITE